MRFRFILYLPTLFAALRIIGLIQTVRSTEERCPLTRDTLKERFYCLQLSNIPEISIFPYYRTNERIPHDIYRDKYEEDCHDNPSFRHESQVDFYLQTNKQEAASTYFVYCSLNGLTSGKNKPTYNYSLDFPFKYLKRKENTRRNQLVSYRWCWFALILTRVKVTRIVCWIL